MRFRHWQASLWAATFLVASSGLMVRMGLGSYLGKWYVVVPLLAGNWWMGVLLDRWLDRTRR